MNNLNTEEQEVRVNLAALYRLLHHYGITDLANQAVFLKTLLISD